MDYSWYSRLLVRRYWLIIPLIFIFCLSCTIVPLVTDKLPSFTDPQAGFEARGTEMARRLRTWTNLREARDELTNNPLEYYYYLQEVENQKTSTTHKPKVKHQKSKSKKRRKKHKKKHEVTIELEDEATLDQHRMHNELLAKAARAKRSKSFPRNSPPPFFCNDPIPDYSRVIVSSRSGDADLWTVRGMRAQCLIDEVLRTSTHFASMCQLEEQEPGRFICCRTWSPANYVAFIASRPGCHNITEADLSLVRQLLYDCHVLYRKGDLTADCADNLTCKLRVPAACYLHGNAVYHMLHYLLDVDFFSEQANATARPLRSALMMLPMAASTASEQYYRSLHIHELVHSEFEVVAMQFGLKNLEFDRLLVADSFFLLFGFAFVTISIWAYTGSFVITLATILVVLFSLGISYSFYRLVLRIQLFPFMNLLAVVVAVGIGSDDAFIFCKVWECTKRDGAVRADATLLRLTHESLRHAVPAMFVSTLTTAVAFFASIVSNVTAINCFSIFSGTTVVVNFLLMITFLPACALAAERLRCDLPLRFRLLRNLQLKLDRFNRLFAESLARLVVSLRWLWLLVFGALSVGACCVVFYRPGLQLPDSPGFQLLYARHPFELYELQYARRFSFERPSPDDAEQAMTMRFVWGVLPADNGDHFDPASRGTLVYDPSFNATELVSQRWLHRFCEQLRRQPFYRSTLGPLLPNCFIETIQPWMERPCIDPVEEIDRSPCCKRHAFPYEPWILSECVVVAIAEMYRTPTHLWNYVPAAQVTAGPRFRPPAQNHTLADKFDVPEIRALIVEYDSNVTFSYSYAELDRFYREVEAWMAQQLESAPPGLRNGWFVSDFEFYELQRTLYEGTIWSVVVSMGLAFTVLGFVTLDPFVSLYAILAVATAIVVTVAALVLLGWRLNVLENVAVSTAIGLTVDFSLHYGVCYRGSGAEHRAQRVKAALDQMAGPTLMAALTTGAAGALVLPSQVLAYVQIGMFLVIVMAVSWLYATFLLCPMLAAAGPSARFARFRIFGARKRGARKTGEHDEPEQFPMRDLQAPAAS